MFEGFIQRIDTSIQLYDIVKGQSYNQRSLSSLVNETFFGELSELEPTKLRCPKAVSIPRLMANVTEMQHFRCDPSNRYLSIFGSDSLFHTSLSLSLFLCLFLIMRDETF